MLSLVRSSKRATTLRRRFGRVQTWRCFTALPEFGNVPSTLPNLTLKEVPNINFYLHLCETTSAFIHEVLQMKVLSVSPGRLTLEMAFLPDMIGNPTPASLHGGVTAAAIDHAAGEEGTFKLFFNPSSHMWTTLSYNM